MKPQVYFGIAIRIIILCAIGMMFTFIPDHLRSFFGDTLREEPEWSGPDRYYDWGVRHYWYAWMVFILFVLSAVNVIVSILSLLKKHYNITP